MAIQSHPSYLASYIRGSSAQMRTEKRYKNICPREALKGLHQSSAVRSALLADAVLSLQKLSSFVAQTSDLLSAVGGLTDLVERIQFNSPLFDVLRPLRDMLFFFPAKFIPMLETYPEVMLLMAHLHAIALFAEPAPNVDLAYFQNINIAPIQTFYDEFLTRAKMNSRTQQAFYQEALSLMEFPLQAASFANARPGSESLMTVTPIGQKDRAGHDIECTSTTITVLENFPIGLWHHMLGAD